MRHFNLIVIVMAMLSQLPYLFSIGACRSQQAVVCWYDDRVLLDYWSLVVFAPCLLHKGVEKHTVGSLSSFSAPLLFDLVGIKSKHHI